MFDVDLYHVCFGLDWHGNVKANDSLVTGAKGREYCRNYMNFEGFTSPLRNFYSVNQFCKFGSLS